MIITGIIPTRYASSRFPGKPLIDIRGKSMIRRVYEQATKATLLQQVIVATDDERIFQHVRDFGGEVVMTGAHHRNGTERCAEVAQSFPSDYYINIQGDEPYIHPEQIDQLAAVLDGQAQLATLVKEIKDASLLDSPTIMKVLANKAFDAIYFSRQCVPYLRDFPREEWLQHHTFLKHIGIYAYRSDILSEIVTLPMGVLEQAESLEQLRWIENGYTIRLALTHHESMSIDTPDDLTRMLAQKTS